MALVAFVVVVKVDDDKEEDLQEYLRQELDTLDDYLLTEYDAQLETRDLPVVEGDETDDGFDAEGVVRVTREAVEEVK